MGRQITQLQVQLDHRKKVLELRRFDRLVQSEEFGDAWTVADDKEKVKAEILIRVELYVLLQKWIRQTLYDNFEKHTVRQLRELASRHHVPYYSRMLHEDLVRALNKKGVTDDVTGRITGHNATDSKNCRCASQANSAINKDAPSQNCHKCV